MEKTLISLLPQFVTSLEQKGRSPSTILAYRADLEQLISYLDGKNKKVVGSIENSDLEGFRDYLLEEKYTAKSTSRKLNAVKTFFRFLESENILTSNPSKDVTHPKIESSTPKFLSQLEYRALRDVVRADVRIATIIELILQTGMRISEVANLKSEYVNDEHIQIEAYATQPNRKIPLNEAAKESVKEYMDKRVPTESPHVFVSKNDKPLAVRNIRAAIDRYMTKAEIPGYSVNDLRTTFIIENLKQGVDIVTISQAAGHKRLSTTERYLELAEIKEPGKKQVLEIL